MPLKSGKSKKTISSNIKELTKKKPGKTRDKAIKALAKKREITYAQARQQQAVAIALSKARKKKR